MHDDMSKLVTDDSFLLPLFQMFIDEDVLSSQDSTPHAIHSIWKFADDDFTVKVFCNVIWV